jgi:hypothetical protein
MGAVFWYQILSPSFLTGSKEIPHVLDARNASRLVVAVLERSHRLQPREALLMLFQPEELGWVSDFTKALQENVPQKKWTALLHQLVQMGVALPSTCDCAQAWEMESWLHQNHAAFNTKVRAAIIATGAREGLYKALYRDITGPLDAEGTYGRIARREYGEKLLDFLRVEPTKEWFKPPVPLNRMYQGSALDHQEQNPGRSN